ncbi:MAG TPA: ABC transporter permease, partial [Vicinamibacterales bacterium]|nr:ABC transporter permease [Vicinamibacterales bacterium]
VPPAEARRTTLVDFGGVSRTYEDVRDVRGMTFRESLAQDVRIGLRMLVRSPGYSLAAIAILALGIGANTAMFSVINGVLLEPLPFRDGDDLVLVRQSAPRSNVADASVSINELFDYRARLTSVRNLVEYHQMNFTLLNQGDPDRVDTGVVSANFFDMLGIKPLAGRTFIDTDDDLGAPAVLVLGFEYWRDKFGGDRSVVGRVLQMNNRPHEIVGILPPYPQYPRRNDVYMPTSACPFRSSSEQNLQASHRTFAGLSVFGRLAEGRSVEQATAEIAAIAESFPRDYEPDYAGTRGFTGQAQYLGETLVSGARAMLYTLVGITALVLLITCANVANLALARTVRRSREMAVRMALGAGRTRLMRQLVTESVLLSSIGGLAGLGLAWLSLDLLVGFMGRFTPRTGQIDIDGTVLAFTAVASVLTGVIFGLAPAFSTGRKLTQAIRDGGAQAGEGGGRQRARSALVVAQVAVSFALLVGAALLLKSFYRLSSVPLGFNSESVMTASITGNFSRATGPREFVELQHNILDRLRATPGVRAAAATNLVPQLLTQPVPPPLVIEGVAATDGRRFEALASAASEGFFAALEIPLLVGRDFSRSDPVRPPPPPPNTPPPVPLPPAYAIINQSMARFWNGVDPIGRRFARPAQAALGDRGLWFTVIGIVPDFHLYNVDTTVAPQYFVSMHQIGGAGGRLIVRADGDPADVARTIRTTVHAVDNQIPVEELLTLDQLHGQQLATPAVTTALLAIFAGVALLVTLAGLAGLVGTSVSQRTREFGLRMALGASRFSVLRLVLGQGLTLTVIGLLLGLGGAYVFSQLVTQFLFETTRTDILVYVVTALVFIAATLVASAGPARRATGIDPLKALRTE